MSKALETSDILDMAYSLVCILDKEMVREILLGEGYLQVDIDEFIAECES